MSPFVLSVLKYSLLVLLYFFIYRAIKSIAVGLRGERRPRAAAPAPSRPARASRGSKAPSAVQVRSGDGRKLGTFRLRGPLEIGRSESCAIRLEDDYVSQMHARLYGKNGAWFVEDLGSTNGTYLNEGRVAAPVEVRAGDRIRVGKTTLELRR